MTTDRKNFESHDFRAIIMTSKYPGVVQLVARDIWERAGAIHEDKTATPQPAGTLPEAGAISAKSLVKKRP